MELKELTPKIISRGNSNYPNLLKEIPDAPSKIYVLGNMPEDSPAGRPRISIVGTRKATFHGRSIAKEIARKLSEQGMVIISGLAMGIDTAAHEGALSGAGQTIAVLACGLDTVYPRQNENLAKKIIETGGAIISEYPVGTPALPNQFLERNRIVSGLSTATIIIEAPRESGSLVTARLAAEQGREVFVFPGPINHPNYHGSHKLIRDGARLVSSNEDILEDLSEIFNLQLGLSGDLLRAKTIFNQTAKFKLDEIKDENQLSIIKVIKEAGQPLNIDKIIGLTKLEPRVVNQAMARLMIEEIIKETEKGYTL